jgi:hypothetical protein
MHLLEGSFHLLHLLEGALHLLLHLNTPIKGARSTTELVLFVEYHKRSVKAFLHSTVDDTFVEYFFRALGKDFAECQKTLGKLRIAKKSKKQQTFFQLGEQPPKHHHYPTIILPFFNIF